MDRRPVAQSFMKDEFLSSLVFVLALKEPLCSEVGHRSLQINQPEEDGIQGWLDSISQVDSNI